MEKPAGAPVAPAHTRMLIEACVDSKQLMIGVSILVFLVGPAKAGSAAPDETAAAAAADAAAILMKSRRERPDLPGSAPSGGSQEESVVIVFLLLCWSPHPHAFAEKGNRV